MVKSQILSVTDTASKRINSVYADGEIMHISVDVGGCNGLQYVFTTKHPPFDSTDIIIQSSNNTPLVLVDQASTDIISGSTLDFVGDELSGMFFKIINPNAQSNCGCGNSFVQKDQL